MAEEVKPADQKPADAGRQGEAHQTPEDASTREVEVDWKELLRLEKERNENLSSENESRKLGIDRLEEENRRLKNRTSEGADERPIGEQVREAVREGLAPIVVDTKIETILGQLVSDPVKREYVKEIYNHRIQKTGTSDVAIRSDLETALDIADSKKTKKENAELKRMNDNNSTYVPPAGGGAGEGGGANRPGPKAHEWSPEQEASLEQRARSLGLDPDKYKEAAWKQFRAGSAFAVQPGPKK